MENFFSQLGVDWKLLLSQLINFGILLAVLTFFVYRPLFAAIDRRTRRIKEGLDKAAQADSRLKDIDVISKGKIKEAEHRAIGIITEARSKSRQLAKELEMAAEARHQELLARGAAHAKAAEEEAERMVLAKASELVRKTLIAAVELQPDQIDEALIRKAIGKIRNEI